MKIPKQIKVGGKIYKVEQTDKLDLGKAWINGKKKARVRKNDGY